MRWIAALVVSFVILLANNAFAQQTPLERYEAQKIVVAAPHFLERRGMDPLRGTDLVPFVGEGRERISAERFYEKLGRPDLAHEYRHRSHIRAARLGLAFTLMGAALATEFTIATDSHRSLAQRDAGTAGAILLDAASIGAIAWSWPYLNANPVPAKEARQLVDDYNARLLRDAGLDPAPEAAEPQHASVRVAPWVGAGGGGLALALRF